MGGLEEVLQQVNYGWGPIADQTLLLDAETIVSLGNISKKPVCEGFH